MSAAATPIKAVTSRRRPAKAVKSTRSKPTTGVGERGRRVEIDEWLEAWHVDYVHHPVLEVHQIDGERSLKNQARLGDDSVDQEFVTRYADAMREGAEFPSLVVYEASNGYVIIDGNHRFVAAREAGYTPSAYVVTAKAQTITAMTFEANVRHGKATTEAERVHHAMYLMDNGMSKKEAAKRMNVPPGKITKAHAQIEAMRRADAAGINRRIWDALPDSTRNRLSQLHTDEALAAAVTLVNDAALGTTEVFDLVARVNDTRSGRLQLKMLDGLRLEYADRIQDKLAGAGAAVGKRVRTPKTALALALGQMTSLPAAEVITDSLGQAERAEYVPRLNAAIRQLTAVRDALR